MNIELKKLRIYSSYSQIKVHFHISAPTDYPDVNAAITQLALLPGCVEYALTYWRRDFLQWAISSVWVSDECRDLHYCSDQIQALFNCLIERKASVIICSEGPRCFPRPFALDSQQRLFFVEHKEKLNR